MVTLLHLYTLSDELYNYKNHIQCLLQTFYPGGWGMGVFREEKGMW
jgi:hypothetical protein